MRHPRVRTIALAGALILPGCFATPAGSAHVRCPNAGSLCVVEPGATIVFELPAQRCAPSERECSFLASIPEDQHRQPGPSERDQVQLFRTTVRGNFDTERVTIVTSREDDSGRRYLEVRYSPMSAASADSTFRVILAYDLKAPQ